MASHPELCAVFMVVCFLNKTMIKLKGLKMFDDQTGGEIIRQFFFIPGVPKLRKCELLYIFFF